VIKIKSKVLIQKCKKIKLLLSDVDGVLTDGGMYYTEKGEIMKKFNTKDGMGVELLRKNKIDVVLITREKSVIVKKRAKKINVEAHIGILDKKKILNKICKKYNVKYEETAYIGDDVNDLEIMKQVGFSASPSDAVDKVKKISNYISSLKGGNGVLREIADMIITIKSDNEEIK
jgi:YrbI family 3-deoxy-D-manno-octulosonate 8-phosphate phosphatase